MRAKKITKKTRAGGEVKSDLEQLPLLPLRDVVVFPNMIQPLLVGRKRSVAAVEKALEKDKRLFIVTQQQPETEDPGLKDLYPIGTLSVVHQVVRLPDGSMKVLMEGVTRCQLVDVFPVPEMILCWVKPVEEPTSSGSEVEALIRLVSSLFENYVKLNPRVPQETLMVLYNVSSDPHRLADAVGSNLFIDVQEKQGILSTLDPVERLRKLCEILNSENEILELEQNIKSQVRKQMEKTQREFYLNEQIKVIQRELGREGDMAEEVLELEEKIAAAKMSPEADEKARKELTRLQHMPMMSPEAAVVRTYLDWLVTLPWKKSSKEQLDIEQAEKILDEDHYGLKKPKERILEYLAVRKLSKHLRGPILCFVGPPGVGKTSLARSIARALNRKFVRVALGGVRDEAEIRGHRRTYIGALPGRIIQSLKRVKTNNPVFLLDEVDKMSTDFRGDPSSALLEVLDPELNNTFSDHYLEVEFDLSDVLFIATANTKYPIPPALRDRMEIIELPSYTEQEKLAIAEQFLVRKQIRANGLSRKRVTFTTDALKTLVRGYTKESGVRNLEREIANVLRKVAKAIASNKAKGGLVIDGTAVEKYLGVPKFRQTEIERGGGVGLATGLAWTEFGGEVLTTEVSIMEGRGELVLTGKLGDVMQESAKAALTYTRMQTRRFGLARDFHQRFDIHVHIPEGAIPKDGPSAGITIATAIISALTGMSVRQDLAMTGEITLRGRVLPVGGIKEKVLAAHRAEIHTVLLPDENRKDLEDIPNAVLQELEIHFVKNMDEVIERALVE
ncbi:MAG TPA: endopeptidase La [bacterium]|nr:endopeptidase La [bacterium]